MGLRFRKSISIIPGVKLNIGTTGMSVSAGVPGFRKTFHTSGRVTTSVGIPGTGLYYVDTDNTRTQNSQRRTTRQQALPSGSERVSYIPENPNNNYSESRSSVSHDNAISVSERVEQLDINSLKSIHKTSDDSIDWTEVLVSPTAPDEIYNANMWEYYHEMAPKILAGDIDAYLQLIYEVNPLDDLLMYGSNFEFGTDDPQKMEVEFVVNEAALSDAKKQMNNLEYNDLLQDYVCSTCIRIARDMFALLPIGTTIVHATLNGNTVVSVAFDRNTLSRIRFGYIDPSDTLSKFKHNMDYNPNRGLLPVRNIQE